jgi:hypothetical protein
VLERARQLLTDTHGEVDVRIKGLESEHRRILARRNILEKKLMNEVIDDETYKRQHTEIKLEIEAVKKQIQGTDGNRTENIESFEHLLRLARNLEKAYRDAPRDLKRRYLNLFWEKIVVQDKQIKEAVPTLALRVLLPQPVITTSSIDNVKIKRS